MEEFKEIRNFEGMYSISKKGNVKSIPRKGRKKEMLLKQSVDKNGYKYVMLFKNSKAKLFRIHQLLAITFLNHTPNGHHIVVDHIDGNKKNNELTNLQLVTERFNLSKDKKGTSKFTGVYWAKHARKWKATIFKDGKNKHLGYYNCEFKAHLQYLKMLRQC